MQAKTEQMEKSVRVSERDYSRKMNDLNRGFEVRAFGSCATESNLPLKSVASSFSSMETKMNEIGSTAIRIGTIIA